MKDLIIRSFKRFLRGSVATFLPTLILIMQNNDFTKAAVISLFLATCTGGLLAVDKFLRELKVY